MIKYLLGLCITCNSFLSYCQEVKVKKGEILVDGVSVGKFEKSGSIFKGRTFTLKTLDGIEILNGSQHYLNSILEQRDMQFFYHSIEFPSLNSRVGLPLNSIPFYTTDDYFVKFFVENKVFHNGKLNIEAANEFIKANPDTIPAFIPKILESEKKSLEDMATILDRDRTKPIEVYVSKPDVKSFYDVDYPAENFRIFQDNVLIGYASFLGSSQQPRKLVFYNVHNTAIARLELSQFGNFRVYSTRKVYAPSDYNIKTTTYSSNILIEAAKFLIAKQGI